MSTEEYLATWHLGDEDVALRKTALEKSMEIHALDPVHIQRLIADAKKIENYLRGE